MRQASLSPRPSEINDKMFKLLIALALVGIAASKPQFASVAYTPYTYSYGSPVAYQQVASPVTYSAPVAYHAAPVAYQAAPVAYQATPVAYQTAPVAYQTAPVAYQTAQVAYTAPVARVAPVTYTAQVAPVARVAPVVHAAPVAQVAQVAPVAYASAYGYPTYLWKKK